METVNISQFLNYIKKYILIIISIILISVLFGVLYIYKKQGTYYYAESYVSIFMTKSSEVSSYLYNDNTLVNTYSTFIKSKKILESVIEELDLNISYNDIKNKVTVIIDEKSPIVKIGVKDTKKENSINIANAIARKYASDDNEFLNNSTVKIDVWENATNSRIVNSISSKKIILLSFIIGSILGFGIVLIKYYFDDRIKSIKIIKEKLGLNILGLIHNTKSKKIKEIDYKSLYSKLLFYSKSNTILIIGTAKNNDSNQIVYNLSNKMSETKKTLIINSNDIKYFADKSINNEELNKISDNLYIINNNDIDNLNKLIEKYSKEFDKILINGTFYEINDFIIISKIVKEVLLIGKMYSDNLEELLEIKESLNSLNIIGIVIDNVDTEQKSFN